MAQGMNIGAARVYLTVDTADYDTAIARALNAAVGFGADAERAFDKASGGTKRAAQRLLDYVADLGKTNTELTRFESLLRKASSGGADASVLKAATRAWDDYATNVALTRIETESWERQTKRAAAAARELEQAQRSEAAAAREAANARAKMYVEGRAAQQAENAQANFNTQLGVQGPRDAGYLAEQRRVVAALEQQVQLEQQIEAEARDINSEVSRWKSQLDAIDKDYYDLQIAQARLRYGVGADPIVKQIEALRQANTTIRGTTVNAKQLQQAMRYLPAQFTDIGVSLAAGMNPALVLFQQGGQIFDQFRLAGAGVKDTFAAIGKQAAKLINPFTLAVAAVSALAIAANAAENDASRLNNALAQTGNYAAQSVEELQGYIAQLNAIPDVSAGTARSAVEAAVGSGRFNGEQFQAVAQAAARMEAEVGQSVDVTIRKFEQIAKSPVDALLRLNDAEHFLTQAQIDRVYQLQEEGKQQEAATLAVNLYADSLNHVADVAASATPHLSMFWKALKDSASDALDTLKGVADEIFAIIDNMHNQSSAWNFIPLIGYLHSAYNMPSRPTVVAGGASPANVQDPKEVARAADELARWSATANEAAQRKNTLNRLSAEGHRLGQSEAAINAVLARQQAQWDAQDAKRAARNAPSARSARSASREVRYEFEAQLAMLRTQARETEAAYSLQEISATKYYETLGELARKERDIQLASNNAQIAAIQGKSGSEQELARLRAQNVQVEQQYLQRDIELRTQQKQIVKQYNDEYRQLVYNLQDGTEAMRQQMELEAISLGMSDKQFGRLQARMEIERDRDRQLRELDRRVEENADFAEEAERRKAAVIEETNRKLAAQAELYGHIDAATGNWLTGAEKAWQEWLDQVADTSGKAYDFFSTAFDGLADLTTDFLTGSEANWKDYLNNLARMITRFVVEQQLTKWMESLKSGGGGGGGGGWLGMVGNFLGALLGSGGGGTVSAGSGPSGNIGPRYAQGGVPGAAGLSAYRNQVVSSPTLFPFAAGGVPNWGLMGEAGREAIVPLTKMPGGNLGVEARIPAGGGAIAIQQTFVVNGTPDRMTRGQMLRMAGSETSRAIRRG